MAISYAGVFLLATKIAFCFSLGLNDQDSTGTRTELHFSSVDQLSQLALAVARASYLPTDGNRFVRNGSIMENPNYFAKSLSTCPADKSEMDAGLCYKPCKKRSSWAFSKGIGPVCRGCPASHPNEQGALCYKTCPSVKPHGWSFMCFTDCPPGYRNHGLTCFRHGHIHNANNARCPWYDVCGLTFSRGCSTCPAGYKNDGCTCRRNPHIVLRPRYNRGVVMKSYGRGVGELPTFFRYNPTSEREACGVKNWVGKAYVNGDTEVVKFTSDEQKIVAFGFRGTEVTSVRDWFANLNFLPVDFWLNNTKLTVHQGFKKRYDKIASDFEKEYASVPPDYAILLTGHGLGGAEASIAAVVAAGKLGRSPDAVITWGSALTGAENFKKFYDEMIGCNVTMNYVTKGDTVARLLNVSGYTHVCDGVQLEPRTKGFFRVRSLYTGYGAGLERKYGNSKKVKLGCDVFRKNDEEIRQYVLGY